MSRMRRREFITLLGGAAAWPLAAHAQQRGGMRRIGVLMPLAADDAEAMARITTFVQTLQELGWTAGRNLRIEYRWAANAERIGRSAAELVALAPDVILSTGSPATAALQQATRTMPIVFVAVTDPVGAAFVDSLAQPGGNVTGFTSGEFPMSGKWLELLKEIAPGVTRVAVLRDASIATAIAQLGVLQSAAPSFGIEVSPVGLRETGEIERAIEAFARGPNGALIVTAIGPALLRRELIIKLAARHRLPAVYPSRVYVSDGGLISYGRSTVDLYQHAASYVDRILKGEKPADLPVQNPTKYELVINLSTAKALGLTVPPTLLARADEVIE
jgi:putative ABC transport system substrate-binding protein